MNRPLISMIVGMYKGEKYIRECIDSVIRQDYTNWRLFLLTMALQIIVAASQIHTQRAIAALSLFIKRTQA